MPRDEAVELARQIVKAYQAIGIGAKTHGGKPFIQRERGWEGPLDPDQLRDTYRDEIARIEWQVRTAVAARFELLDNWQRENLSREMLVEMHITPEDFLTIGLSDHEARLYSNVAMHLHFTRQGPPL